MKFYFPPQISRLVVMFAVFIILFLILKHFLTPDTFGDLGHYRAAALEDHENMPLKYASDESCFDCHDDIFEFKKQDMHVDISCETCHGPGLEHVNSMEAADIMVPAGRDFCGRCHYKNAGRPGKVVTQIEPGNHNVDQDCIECHNSHQPWELKE